MRDLQPRGDAAAVGHVRLRKGHRAGRHHLLKLVDGVQILARRHGQRTFAQDAHRPSTSSGIAGSSNQYTSYGANACVDHERNIGAEEIAHGRNALHVLSKLVPADLHLGRAESVLEVLMRLFAQGIHGQLQVDAASVDGDPLLS